MDARDGWNQSELARAGALARELRTVAGPDATIIAARAPGRVNLIGEHTDYSGLPVLPVAIDRSTIVVAVASRHQEITIQNADRAWPARHFRIERKIPPFEPGDWANYVKAAIQGVIDRFCESEVPLKSLRGAIMTVDGGVPLAAGLSSSAALTVSSALAFMAVNHLELDPLATATMVARSEWYVGTMAGGMDQAASMLGRRDHALFIEFDPLRVKPVPMTREVALVVADSREIADKSGKVRDEYNRRVVECALAARILARALSLDGVRILGDVVRKLATWKSSELVAELQRAAPPTLDADLVEAAKILGSSRDALAADLLGSGPSRVRLNPALPLRVLARARHVLSETERTIRATAALEASRLEEMGALMNESHQSLATDFECSTRALDRMVEIARSGGALGARLTGAGFGGSIVSLCRSEDAPRVIAALDREYYAPLRIDAQSSRAILHAGAGASTIELAAA